MSAADSTTCVGSNAAQTRFQRTPFSIRLSCPDNLAWKTVISAGVAKPEELQTDGGLPGGGLVQGLFPGGPISETPSSNVLLNRNEQTKESSNRVGGEYPALRRQLNANDLREQ